MRRVVALVTLCLAAVVVTVAANPSKPGKPIKLPKGMNVPPDIQAIIDKQNRGETLSWDDIQKLQAWAQGIQSHMPGSAPVNPANPSQPADAGVTVPTQVDVTAHYTRRTGGTLDTVTISESTRLDLLAKINGTDDYARNVLDPGAHVSTFFFQPSNVTGTGHYHFHQDASGSTDFDATMASVTGSVMLVTIGGDTLGIIPGQINGEVTGTYHTTEQDGKSHDHAYQGQMRESLLELLFPSEAHTTKDRAKPDPKPRAQISYKQLVAAIQSGKQTPIKVSEHFDWNDHGEQVAGDVDVTFTLRPAPVPRLEARIVPDTSWDDWKPEGPTPKAEHGNTFVAHIALFDAQTNKPWQGRATVEGVDFKLEDVSHLPGVCTNWPRPDRKGFEKKPDLFFAESNKHGKVGKKDPDRQTFHLDSREWSEKVTIESRDFGSYGNLTAKVKLAGAEAVDAKFEPLSTTYLPLPRDDDHNHIADSYKPALNLDAASDDESTPGLARKGDGFTAFEEYRGFLLAPHRTIVDKGAENTSDEQLVRLDPRVRELLVVIEVKPDKLPLVEQGIQVFEKAAQIKVYALSSVHRTAPHVGDNGRARGIVFNPTPEERHPPDVAHGMVGVWITSMALSPPSVARTWTASDTVDCDTAPPKDCIDSPYTLRYVAIGKDSESESTINWMMTMLEPDPSKRTGGAITLAAARDVDAYLRKHGISDERRRAAIAAGRASMQKLVEEMSGFAIAHELSHVLGAQHHGVYEVAKDRTKARSDGAENCPLRYWQELNGDSDDATKTWKGFITEPKNAIAWLDYLSGTWNPAVTGPSGPWMICDDNRAQMHFQE